ncbi:MAG TPA: N-6 DNA methylase, partial [Flavitalea sp.]|nr:N-6 DNA methylase [Flavitalea sp.]
YTPLYIRDYIVGQTFERTLVIADEVKIADISCGCGGFLLTSVAKIRSLTNKRFGAIYRENIYGIDITNYSIERAKLLLSLFAIVNGEDEEAYTFNLFTENSLTFDWRLEVPAIQANGGFDLIVGNPPYVASRNMDQQTLELLNNIAVAGTGHPDLYIPFFQIGYELLNVNGILGYITVNTFIKSINGRALRQYFQDHHVVLELINFGGEQVFQDRNTYTCICFLSHGNGIIRYRRSQSQDIEQLLPETFIEYRYETLNHTDGWNLTNALIINEYIDTIEAIGLPFREKYVTKNGIATLRNNVYKFKPVADDNLYYYFQTDTQAFPIERDICRDIVNANKLKAPADLVNKLEKIIFPYTVVNGKVEIIPESELRTSFPMTYQYLLNNKDILARRDKGTRDYEVWYAYGRRQSMDINQFKLFFPHICERPTFVISEDPDLLFYNGIAVVSNDLHELLLLKKLMETNVFYTYIRATTKDYSSGYISMSRNYLKNFGIYDFTDEEKTAFLNSEDPGAFIIEKYGVEIPDLLF